MAGVLIEWSAGDGAEHSERWPSVERFRLWAAAEGRAIRYAAFSEDEDGDWILIERRTIGGRWRDASI